MMDAGSTEATWVGLILGAAVILIGGGIIVHMVASEIARCRPARIYAMRIVTNGFHYAVEERRPRSWLLRLFGCKPRWVRMNPTFLHAESAKRFMDDRLRGEAECRATTYWTANDACRQCGRSLNVCECDSTTSPTGQYHA